MIFCTKLQRSFEKKGEKSSNDNIRDYITFVYRDVLNNYFGRTPNIRSTDEPNTEYSISRVTQSNLSAEYPNILIFHNIKNIKLSNFKTILDNILDKQEIT